MSLLDDPTLVRAAHPAASVPACLWADARRPVASLSPPHVVVVAPPFTLPLQSLLLKCSPPFPRLPPDSVVMTPLPSPQAILRTNLDTQSRAEQCPTDKGDGPGMEGDRGLGQ